MFELTWQNPEARGWRDVLPPSWFEIENVKTEIRHDSYTSEGSHIVVQCSLKVEGRYAWLDYGAGQNASHNQARGVFCDYLRLTFSNESRTYLDLVEFLVDGKLSRAEVLINNSVDSSFAEGDLFLRQHLHRERDSSLRNAKIAEVLEQTGQLLCETCDFDARGAYSGIVDACEVHHRLEIREGPRQTQLQDLAILCASCHFAIHRATRPMPSVKLFRDTYVQFRTEQIVSVVGGVPEIGKP